MVEKLVAKEGLLKGTTLAFEKEEEIIIGRDPDASQFVLEDASVSRRHATIYPTPEGWTLENLSATNPILINGTEIDAPYPLQAGDEVKIGETLFTFEGKLKVRKEKTSSSTNKNEKEKKEVVEETAADTEEEPPAEEEADEEEEIKEEEVDEEEEEIKEEEHFDTVFQGGEEDGMDALHFGMVASERWMLKIVAGPNVGAEIPLEIGRDYTIGTNASKCDIVLNDISVSKEHARLTLSEDQSLKVDDLKSRNGTYVEGKKIEEAASFQANTLITVGTTTFVIVDREAAAETVFSAPLPFTTIQPGKGSKEEEAAKKAEMTPEEQEALKMQKEAEEKEKQLEEEALRRKTFFRKVGYGFVAIIALLLFSLFWSTDIEENTENAVKKIQEIVSPFPEVRIQYNRTTGKLLLLGHVLTSADLRQIAYGLQGLPFIDSELIDNNIVVDELTRQQTNQDLASNPNLRGVTLNTPAPGRFVLVGYLTTTSQKQELNDYLKRNFLFLDLLENRVVVEQEILEQTANYFQEKSIPDIRIEINNGEITLRGLVGFDQSADFQEVLESIRQLNGVKSVKNFVASLEPEEAMINLTGQYEITGFSKQDNVSTSVVINGRILSRGDSLDGMTITSIKPTAVFLERDGFKYRIDYNK